MKKNHFIHYLLFAFMLNSTFAAMAQKKDPCFELPFLDGKKGISIKKSIMNSKEKVVLTPFDEIDEIFGLSVTMDVKILSEDFLIRILLEDTNGSKYVVAEFYKEVLGEEKDFHIENYCEETAFMKGVKPANLSVYAKSVDVSLNSVMLATEGMGFSDTKTFEVQAKNLRLQQIQAKTARINDYIRANDKLWKAGVTGLSLKRFEDRMRVLGCSEGNNTHGIEYYVGGIIDIGLNSATQQRLSNNSPFVEEFDWRDRHGKNWLTPVKDQGNSGYCSSFTAVSCTEALVNLYLNNLVNLDLSEQEVASCNTANANNYSENFYEGPLSLETALQFIKDSGVCDEVAYPFVDDSLARFCHSDIISPHYKVYINSYSHNLHYNSNYNPNEDSIKSSLIHYGPLSSGIYVTDGINHAMALVGYGIIREGNIIQHIWNYSGYDTGLTDTIHVSSNNPLIGRTYWIFKNSYANEGTANPPYMLVTMDYWSSMITTYALYDPRYIEYTQDGGSVIINNVVCEDADGDGYFFWGLGPKPSNAPLYCPDEADGDDSNPLRGIMNQYGFCEDLNPETRPIDRIVSSQSTTEVKRQYSHIVITNNSTWNICHDIYFHNGANITISSGCTLELTNGAVLDNAEIVMESGSTLRINNNGIINLRDGVVFNPPIGANVYVNYGEIR